MEKNRLIRKFFHDPKGHRTPYVGTEKFVKILVTHRPLKCTLCVSEIEFCFPLKYYAPGTSKTIHQYQTSTTDHKFMLPFGTKVGSSTDVLEMLTLFAYTETNLPQEVGKMASWRFSKWHAL